MGFNFREYVNFENVISKKLLKRFCKRIKKCKNGCWEYKPPRKLTKKKQHWKFALSKTEWIFVHRLAYLLVKGKLKSKICVCHACDNPICVRPKHLFKGTKLNNNQDRVKKGYGFKLTNADVIYIRDSKKSRKVLSKLFDISCVHVWRIQTNKSRFLI